MFRYFFMLSLFLFFGCDHTKKIDTSSWKLNQNGYFTFHHPDEAGYEHTNLGFIVNGWLRGEITFTRFKVELISLRDSTHVSPCTGHTNSSEGNCETRSFTNYDMELCIVKPNADGNNVNMRLCINGKHLFIANHIDREDVDLVKEILFSIRMR